MNQPTNCATCGEPFEARAGARYCQRSCYPSRRTRTEQGRRRYVDTACTWCSKPTTSEAARGHDPVCSRDCQTNLTIYKRGQVSRPWPRHMQECTDCGQPYPTKSKSGQHRCPTCLESFWASQRKPDIPKTRFVSCQCPRCGAWWIGDRMAGSNAEAYCSDRCARGDAKDRRRARQRAAFRAPVYRHRIFARDEYRCHICKTMTDPTKSVPHPKAPTIDHIVPLASGGTHEPANVATACFLCNCLKGDRYAGEQLDIAG